MNIDVANAFQMREHRHAGFRHNAAGQSFAAARDEQIDRAIDAFEHQPDRGAICRF